MALTHSTQEMSDNLEYATNMGARLAGRADAIAHVGKLLTGEYTPEQLDAIHAEILDRENSNNDEVQITGYEEAWDVLFNLVYGRQPNELHKTIGPFA